MQAFRPALRALLKLSVADGLRPSRSYRDRAWPDSSLSTDCFTDIYRVLSLPAVVLRLRGGGGATARRSERQLAGSQAGCPVPSVLRGWARPCAASELATHGTPRSDRDFPVLPGVVRATRHFSSGRLLSRQRPPQRRAVQPAGRLRPGRPQRVLQRAPAGAAAPGASSLPGAPGAAGQTLAAAPAPGTTPLVGAAEERDVRVETPHVVAVFTNRGARLKSWRLKAYKDNHGEPLELVATELASHAAAPVLASRGR